MHELVSALIEIDRHIEEMSRLYDKTSFSKLSEFLYSALKTRTKIIESLTGIRE